MKYSKKLKSIPSINICPISIWIPRVHIVVSKKNLKSISNLNFFVKSYLLSSDREQIWQEELRRYMYYKARKDLPLAWDFDDLIAMPIFMKNEVYKILDEIMEEQKKLQHTQENPLASLFWERLKSLSFSCHRKF